MNIETDMLRYRIIRIIKNLLQFLKKWIYWKCDEADADRKRARLSFLFL